MVEYVLLIRVFFFFKQKTAYELRISDWSSDVCSSDLPFIPLPLAGGVRGRDVECEPGQALPRPLPLTGGELSAKPRRRPTKSRGRSPPARSDRKSVV